MKPKKCRTCREAEMSVAAENYNYAESGLPNVVLMGVPVRRCPACGAHELVLPNVTQLHAVLARVVAEKKTPLTGAEIRFLRTYLGLTSADFAAVVGVGAPTVSRWENERESVGASSERLIRTMALREAAPSDYQLFDMLKQIRTEKAPSIPIKVKATNQHWATA